MTVLIQQRIRAAAPNLFRAGPTSPYQRVSITVPDGWEKPLMKLVRTLEEIITKTGHDIEVHQIKSKFGKLRFYIGKIHPEIYNDTYNAILEAEVECAGACEVCGNHGFARTGRWINTLCDDHALGREVLDANLFI